MKKVLIGLFIFLVIEIIGIFCYYFFYYDMLPARMVSIENETSNIQNSEN